ncbi:MAG: class I SAM-dependent methyltransferase [Candidatus Latescibacteria bacterium]|nr:class I SAM-dependent methyltransferase [Candidatus Latescibacterota bacterium]
MSRNRYQREQAFYNREIADRWTEDLFDRRVQEARRELLEGKYRRYDRYHYTYVLLGNLVGKRILECGCGTGLHTVLLSMMGARVSGFDIAEKAAEMALKNAKRLGVGDRIDITVAAAEDMAYRSASFDLVVGFVALHHFDLSKTIPEILRVLKPHGRAIFMEPLAESRVLRAVRRLIPLSDHESPGGRQLRYKDIEEIRPYFSKVSYKEFELLTRLTRIPVMKRYIPQIRAIDCWLLHHLPTLRRYGRLFVIEMEK